ncbi:uncharacterized protein LOC130629805 isoform X2 [Hydractinia symbiolongicarpus]|uniref:uncharacterized protein LOC130629805 isoform X2 n=1 Tax=Hydractinia symbiolongicarpus TaxID=13093 RepID=UPI002551C8FD|nr:uncharacterized protein LOC130629805 isoform X2 [Hydractinia symbiolongicarpus]
MHVVFEKAGNLLILRNFTVILFSKYLLHFFLIEELVCAITFKRYRESAKKDLPCKYSETEDLKMLPMMAFLNVARYVTHHYNMYMCWLNCKDDSLAKVKGVRTLYME